MNQYERLLDHLISEAHEDEVGLWYIVNNVRRELGVTDAREVRRVTMEFVRKLLESGAVDAGYYDAPSPFKPWSLTNNEVIARINDEWDKLERDPNIAEIVVFVSKDKSRAMLAQQTAAADSAGSR